MRYLELRRQAVFDRARDSCSGRIADLRLSRRADGCGKTDDEQNAEFHIRSIADEFVSGLCWVQPADRSSTRSINARCDDRKVVVAPDSSMFEVSLRVRGHAGNTRLFEQQSH